MGIESDEELFPAAIRSRARQLRLLVLDVDGVLTDGGLQYGPEGESVKTFNVKDGLGIRLLEEDGIEVAVISARHARALERRLADLRVAHAYLGRGDKRAALDELLTSLGVELDTVAFMGDDVLDLPVLREVGMAIAPADANVLVRRELRRMPQGWVTRTKGGRGAVREVADGLLEARGHLETVVEAHLAARGKPNR